MATRSDPLPIWIARVLSTYSLPIYAVGLAVIVLSRVVEGTDGIPFPRQLRQIVVAVTLAVMVGTYLAERRYARGRGGDGPGAGSDEPADEEEAPEYSLYARAAMAAAAVGVAIGIYVGIALERLFVGALFILGAYLFVHMAYRHEGKRGED